MPEIEPTSGLEKKRTSHWNVSSCWYCDRSNWRAILHEATKFRPNRATRCGVMTLYTISRWRLRRLHPASYLLTSLSSKVNCT